MNDNVVYGPERSRILKKSIRNAVCLCALIVATSVFSSGIVRGAHARPVPENMTLIPAGEFLMGSSDKEIEDVVKVFGKLDLYKTYPFDAEKPKRRLWLKAYYIDRHEVTNKEYAKFVEATGYRKPAHWEKTGYEKNQADTPVSFVTYRDAAAYAKWAGKRMPTEAEWEKAARGDKGFVFPWGNTFDPYMASTADSDLKFLFGPLCNANTANKVEMAEGDKSPYGVRDMAGNLREWTASSDDKNPDMMIVKGASWLDRYINARVAHREFVHRDFKSHIIGFRCVKDLD